MLLAATEKGIGSLWICDIYFVYSELCKWLDSDGQLIAAIAFGYPNEFPKERPRKKIKDMIYITYELKVLNKKNNPFVWIYGIFKLQHLRKI